MTPHNVETRPHTHMRTGAHAGWSLSLQRWRTVSSQSQLTVYVSPFFTHGRVRQRRIPRRRLLWFLSYLKRLFLIPPTRSATADDARPWTLISSPYIHQTGKIDYFLSLPRCWSNSEWLLVLVLPAISLWRTSAGWHQDFSSVLPGEKMIMMWDCVCWN